MIFGRITKNFGQSGRMFGFAADKVAPPSLNSQFSTVANAYSNTYGYDTTKLTAPTKYGWSSTRNTFPVFLWPDVAKNGGTGQSDWNDPQVKHAPKMKAILNFGGNILVNQTGQSNYVSAMKSAAYCLGRPLHDRLRGHGRRLCFAGGDRLREDELHHHLEHRREHTLHVKKSSLWARPSTITRLWSHRHPGGRRSSERSSTTARPAGPRSSTCRRPSTTTALNSKITWDQWSTSGISTPAIQRRPR